MHLKFGARRLTPWTLNIRHCIRYLIGNTLPALVAETSLESLGLLSSIPREEAKTPGCLIWVVKGYFWKKNFPETQAGIGLLASCVEGTSYVLNRPPRRFARCIRTVVKERRGPVPRNSLKNRSLAKAGLCCARYLSVPLLRDAVVGFGSAAMCRVRTPLSTLTGQKWFFKSIFFLSRKECSVFKSISDMLLLTKKLYNSLHFYFSLYFIMLSICHSE